MSKSFPLTVVILAKNEAANIARCVSSVAWCDEVVVVDDGSTDETCSLARSLGARVVEHKFQSFASQRNWALENACLKNEWVLMLDADEESSDAFRLALEAALSQADASVVAFRNCRKTMFHGRWVRYADEFPCWIMRTLRRGRARFEDCGHGEVPVPKVDGLVGTLSEPFLHYPFSHGLSDWLVRHVAYAEREARLELEQKARLIDAFSFDRSLRRRGLRDLSRRLPMRSTLRFCYHFWVRLGFLDGPEGLSFSRLKSIYEAMIVAKRVELASRERKI